MAVGIPELDLVAAPIGYLRVRAFVFLTEGDRTSGVEGTHQVLADTGEISVSVVKFLSDI